MEEANTDTMDAELTMKPVYRFTWFASKQEKDSGAEPIRQRRTDELTNDSPDFREAGVEALAERGRADDSCEVTLVGFTEM